MPLRPYLFAGAAWAAISPASAQDAPPVGPAAEAAAPAVYTDDEEETIVVTGAKPRGSVVGDIPPENVLTPRDIKATGATSIAELLKSVAAQTGSTRGRGGGGRPIVLLNGQRISGFRELRDLPPEAIERMEILPEEVALKYGYSADQRVVNIVLRRRFDSTTVEARGNLATDGGYASGGAQAGKLLIREGNRTSLDFTIDSNSQLLENERDIAYDPAAGPDPRGARTLTGAGQSYRLTGVANRPLGLASLTLTGEAGRTAGESRFGLSPLDGSALARDTKSDSLALGAALNAMKDGWRLSSTANLTYEHSVSESERSVVTAVNDDIARSTRRSAMVDATATGDLFALPAGKVGITARLGLSHSDIDSESRRQDVNLATDLARSIAEGSLSIDVPLLARDAKLGRLSLNLNGGLKGLSDFGTLASVGAGLNWQAAKGLSLLSSVTREEGAPSLQQLGDPVLETGDVPFFDAVRGETVGVTTITGGNRDLDADRRTVWKLGGNWQPKEEIGLRLRADFVHEAIDRPQISFPAVTPALEAAFPDRFVRNGSGQLIQADLRPVNARRSRRDTVRFGLDFTKPLKPKPPTAAQVEALRDQFRRNAAANGAPAAPAAPATGSSSGPAGGEPPAVIQFGDGERGGRFGGGGGGGGGGRGRGGQLNFSLTDTVTLRDELTIADDLPVLDYLDGEAAGSTGGRARHQVEAQGGYYNNGLGARVSANWRSATRVETEAGTVRFADYATVDLRLFANLGERFDLITKSPFFRGSSVRFEVKNLFNARPAVRGADGSVPPVYFPDRLEPIGRTIGISFRKMFLPTRFQIMDRRGGPSQVGSTQPSRD